MLVIRHQRVEGGAILPLPRRAERAQCAPVKAAHGSENLGAPCRKPRKLDSCFNSFCAGIAEENTIHPGWQRGNEPLQIGGAHIIMKKFGAAYQPGGLLR